MEIHYDNLKNSINSIIDDVANGIYTDSKFAALEIDHPLSGKIQVQIMATKDQDEFIDDIEPCIIRI